MFLNQLSNTKTDVWEQCRLKYKYRYVDKFLGDPSPNEDSLSFGTYIHEIFELGVNATHLTELERIAEDLKSKHKIPHIQNERIKVCLRNFLRFNEDLNFKKTQTLGTEIEYKLDLGSDIHATGIIDRVIKSTSGNILVIDYKTSKREKTKVQLYMDGQLKGYALAACDLYKIPLSEASSRIICAHYYPLTNNFVPVTYKGGDLLRHRKKIVDTSWNIRKATLEQLTPRRNEFCDWCNYKSMCPIYADGASIQCRINEEKQKLIDAKAIELLDSNSLTL